MICIINYFIKAFNYFDNLILKKVCQKPLQKPYKKRIQKPLRKILQKLKQFFATFSQQKNERFFIVIF